MYAFRSLLLLLGCISSALTANVTNANLARSDATASSPVTFSTDAEGLSFTIPQYLANNVSSSFDQTCTAGAGKKRLRKRGLSNGDIQCITNSAEYAVKNAASSADLQSTLLLFPTDFPSLTGPLVTAINKLAVFIQNPVVLFSPALFSPGRIHAILAVFVGLAFTLWMNRPGTEINQVTIPYYDLENVASTTPSDCPSLTFSWTSPTLSTTVVPIPCPTTSDYCPCSPVETAIAYEGTDDAIWAADLLQYNLVIDSPICWPDTQSQAGPTSTYCVCAGTSDKAAYYSTISGASGETACAYSASSDLPSVQYVPVTVAATTTTSLTTSCTPTVTTFVETYLSPVVSFATITNTECSCNGAIIGVTSWTLNGTPTVQCSNGQTAPTPTITSAPNSCLECRVLYVQFRRTVLWQ